MLENALDAPKATAGKNGDLGCRLWIGWLVEHRRRDQSCTLGPRREAAQRNART